MKIEQTLMCFDVLILFVKERMILLDALTVS